MDVTCPVGLLPLVMSIANSSDLGSIQEYSNVTSLRDHTQAYPEAKMLRLSTALSLPSMLCGAFPVLCMHD